MRSLAVILALAALGVAAPLYAQEIAYETVEVRVEHFGGGGERMLEAPQGEIPQGLAAYGPFSVLDTDRAALVDETDADSPAQVERTWRDYPGLAVTEKHRRAHV